MDKYIEARPHNPNMDPAVQRRIDSALGELGRAREALRGMRCAAVEQQAVADRVGGHTVRTSDRTRQSELYTRAYYCAQRREKTKPRKKKSKKGKKGKKKKKKKKKHKSSSGSISSASGSDLSSGGVFRKAWGANSTSAVQLARRSPGTLSRIFVRTLQQMIRGRGHVSEPGGANIEAIVTTYVTTLLIPNNSIQKRNTRELLTLATVLDHLFFGKSRKHAMCSASASKQSSPPL